MVVPLSAKGFEPIYNSWRRMHERCNNPRHEKFPQYGGRGITVCPEWKSWPEFLDWAILNGWRTGLTLDRWDNDEGYSPDNCRWATAEEQTLNRRNVHKNSDGVAFFSIAQQNGINPKTFQDRIARGWSPEDAATIVAAKATGRHSK